jgi:hypothetical protein
MAMTEVGTKAAHSVAILSLWYIWKERSARVFNDSRCTEQAVFARIRDECYDWISAGGRVLSYIRIAPTSMSN